MPAIISVAAGLGPTWLEGEECDDSSVVKAALCAHTIYHSGACMPAPVYPSVSLQSSMQQ